MHLKGVSSGGWESFLTGNVFSDPIWLRNTMSPFWAIHGVHILPRLHFFAGTSWLQLRRFCTFTSSEFYAVHITGKVRSVKALVSNLVFVLLLFCCICICWLLPSLTGSAKQGRRCENVFALSKVASSALKSAAMWTVNLIDFKNQGA